MYGTVYLYVFDTLADWEIGYLTAELNSGRYFRQGLQPTPIVTVSNAKVPIKTMGGLAILPDLTVAECSLRTGDALILPGGETWMTGIHEPILKKAGQCLEAGIAVAAICGATLALAENGPLNARRHTSNDLEYLKAVCPHYQGEVYYRDEPAVTDGGLVTASGIAPLEFATAVLKMLGVFNDEALAAWYSLYKTHDPARFHDLMTSIQ